MKTELFQSCGHCWVFQICWHIECSTFTASSFRIWNSSTGIPSHPLALFVVMLPKALLTSHSRMPGSRWVITPSWLSGSWRSFLYSSSVYYCHLFLISSASVRSIPFLWNTWKYLTVQRPVPPDSLRTERITPPWTPSGDVEGQQLQHYSAQYWQRQVARALVVPSVAQLLASANL